MVLFRKTAPAINLYWIVLVCLLSKSEPFVFRIIYIFYINLKAIDFLAFLFSVQNFFSFQALSRWRRTFCFFWSLIQALTRLIWLFLSIYWALSLSRIDLRMLDFFIMKILSLRVSSWIFLFLAKTSS